MIKFILLMIFFFMGTYSLQAQEGLGDDEEFLKTLDTVKNPFEEGIPMPIPPPVQKPAHHHGKKHKKKDNVKPPEKQKQVVKPAEIVLPALQLQGVIVGGDIQQAIINDNIVPLQGIIDGAQVDSVTKQGVAVTFKGKKFFLKVE
jgi:hypothetical protein